MLYDRNYNFTAGETIIADQIDDEFNSVRTILNGNIEADNIKDGSITTDKLDATLDPTTRTAETIGDVVVSGLELQGIRSLTGTWTNRDESISNGTFYIDGVRVTATFGGGAEAHTYTASTTTYVLIDESGVLHYETSLSVGYNNVPLYEVTCDGSKITAAAPLAWGLIGTVIPFAGKTAPSGYISCEGQEVSRTTYSKLYNAIQNFYGTPSGATVFKVPDLRARAPYGYGDPTYYTVFGAKGGTVTHTHTTADHTHSTWDGGHGHSMGGGHSHSGSDYVYNFASASGPYYHHHDTWDGGHAHSMGGASAGNTTSAGSDVAPYITMRYIIKAQ